MTSYLEPYGGTLVVDVPSIHRLLDALDLPAAVVDARGRLAILSPALARLLGGEFRPIPVRLFTEVYAIRRPDADEWLPAHEFPLIPAIAGDVTTTVGRVVADDGSERYLAFRAAPLIGLQGETTAVVCTATDVTGAARAGEDQAGPRPLLEPLLSPLQDLLSNVPVLRDRRPGRR